MDCCWLLAALLCSLAAVDAFYFPVLAPTNYCEETVRLKNPGKCEVSFAVLAS